jgi:prepilin-type N-terminal cleavage/methylation domain-containing protein
MEGRINSKFVIRDSKLKKGFTLAEILILLIVIGILISGAFSLFSTVITANKTAEYFSNAYKLLDAKVETTKQKSFDSIITESFSVPELPNGQGTITVTNNIDGSPQSDIKQIDVIISWTFKKTHQVRAVTYIAKGGIGR